MAEGAAVWPGHESSPRPPAAHPADRSDPTQSLVLWIGRPACCARILDHLLESLRLLPQDGRDVLAAQDDPREGVLVPRRRRWRRPVGRARGKPPATAPTPTPA